MANLPQTSPQTETAKTSCNKLTYFKEGVTAILGITIIIATLWLMWPALSSGNPENLPMANGIFAILGGWGGVVLGYYFGRIPAEKAADAATDSANKAKDETKQANTDKTKTIIEANKSLESAANALIKIQESISREKAVAQEVSELKEEMEKQINNIKLLQEKIINRA